RPAGSTLFPYTTLFRSEAAAIRGDTEKVATTRPLAVEHDRAVGGPRGVSERPVARHRDHVDAAGIDIRKADRALLGRPRRRAGLDRKSTRLNSSDQIIS